MDTIIVSVYYKRFDRYPAYSFRCTVSELLALLLSGAIAMNEPIRISAIR